MKVKILVLGGLISGLLFLFNCSGTDSSKIKVKFAMWGDVEEIKILEKTKKEFEKANPDIKIVFEHSAIGSYRDKILTEAAGGTPPDVIFMATSKFSSLVEKGLFEPLDNFIANDNDIDIKKYYKSIVGPFTVKGKLYILPRDIAPGSVIYYNKQMFDETGIKYPDNSWTMNDFVEKAKALTKYDSTGKPVRFGFHTWIWHNFLYMYGGRIVDNIYNPKKFLLTSKKSLKGLKFYHDLMYKYKVMPTPVLAGSLDMSFTMLFSMKKVGMILSGIWETPVFLKNNNFKWDIVVFPSYKNGVWGGGSGYGIARLSRHKEAAWKVVKFFAGIQGQKELAKSGLAQPAIRELALSKYFMDPAKIPENKIILDKSADYIILDPMFADWNEIEKTVINPNLDLYFYNKIDLSEFKKNIDTEIKNRYSWLEIP